MNKHEVIRTAGTGAPFVVYPLDQKRKKRFSFNRFFHNLVTIIMWAGIIVAIYNKLTWEDSIKNPANDAYVTEVAWNLGIEKHEVTQAQFNRRYK